MLGGLHTQMSFLGCIGYIMAGSGIEDILELVYTKITTIHMLSGKAIARAIRGHSLVDEALNSLLACKALGIPAPFERIDQDDEEAHPPQQPATDIDLELLKQLCKKSLETPQTSGQGTSSSCLDSTKKKIEETKASLSGKRTAVLWLEYMKMVDILRKFIKGERTGNWKMHLQAVYEMLPYFAAAGHNQYAKSAYVYLQTMQNLETSHPSVYKKFLDGLHVVRRSDRFWGGLSTDLIIEQVR